MILADVLRRSDRIALVEAGRSITYSELIEAAAVRAQRLPLESGECLALWAPNRIDWLVTLFACALRGILVAALNTRFRSAEVGPLLAAARARAIVLEPDFLGIDYRAILLESDSRVPELQLAAGAISPLTEGGPADLCAAFTTSGTTSAPKLAAHDQDSCARHAVNAAAAFDIRPGDVALVALPLCGVFGFNSALAALAGQATVHLQPAFDPGAAARLIDRVAVTHFNGSDAMVKAVVDQPGFRGASLRRCGFANFTGYAAELAALGPAFTGVYGSSECFALITGWSPADPPAVRALAGGRPIHPEIEVRERDGELQLRGYNVVSGYLHNRAADAAAFTADGWFRSGDHGRVTAEGGVVFLARLGDSLRLRGFLVDPTEIEEELQRHPAIAAAQVVGVEQPGAGQVPIAFVVATAPFDEADLIAHCRERIANYKVPVRIVAVAEFPSTPGPNGVKVQKARLREMAAELLA